MDRICTVCYSKEKYYAKGMCRSCYTKVNYPKYAEKRRAYDRQRQKTEKRRQQDRDRHVKHRPKRNLLCRNYRKKNLNRLREYDRLRWTTPERKEAQTRYKLENIVRIRELDRAEYRRNKSRHIARVMERRGHQGRQTPKWLTKEQRLQIELFYKNRPQGFHVDHIVPLRGDIVSGLHVPWNLQYLPAQENLKKGNKLL